MPEATQKRGRTLKIAAVSCLLSAGLLSMALVHAPAHAQSSANQDWAKAAGGKMSFDVASVRQDADTDSDSQSNVPLRSMDSFSDSFAPTGGLFQASNFLVIQYIAFAYKLSPEEAKSVQLQLPKWAGTNEYDIVARAGGNPTKDQFRLMMQALLADRFKLLFHYETKPVPVFALMLEKPGKLGPNLREHKDDGAPCTTASASGPEPTTTGGFPVQCGTVVRLPGRTSGITKMGARGIRSSVLANVLGVWYQTERPVVDDTGLGFVDFTIEFTPDRTTNTGRVYDPDAPTFIEAMKEQLGLKFVSRTASVRSMIVDHVEEPSAN
jgi:uncharacterized protein (TIGR03435 family)